MFVDELPRYKRLLSEPASYWVDIIKRYFVKGQSIVVSFSPSLKGRGSCASPSLKGRI